MSSMRVYVVRQWDGDGTSEIVGIFDTMTQALSVAGEHPDQDVDAYWLNTTGAAKYPCGCDRHQGQHSRCYAGCDLSGCRDLR